MHRCKNARAVDNLKEKSSPEAFVTLLDEFWECWLTHDDNTHVSTDERKEKLFLYKSTRKFLEEIG